MPLQRLLRRQGFSSGREVSPGQGGKDVGKEGPGVSSHLRRNPRWRFHPVHNSVHPSPAPAAPTPRGVLLGGSGFHPEELCLSTWEVFWGVSLGCGDVPSEGMLGGPSSDCGASTAPMEYISTRGGVGAVDFEGALFSGYAPDGGLFMPQCIPTLDRDTLQRWSRLSYRELVKELCSLFITAELVPRDTLNGEPQPRGELLAVMCARILGCSDAPACLHPFTAPRVWSAAPRMLLSLFSSSLSPCWGLLPSGKGVPCAIGMADAVVLLTAGGHCCSDGLQTCPDATALCWTTLSLRLNL